MVFELQKFKSITITFSLVLIREKTFSYFCRMCSLLELKYASIYEWQ